MLTVCFLVAGVLASCQPAPQVSLNPVKMTAVVNGKTYKVETLAMKAGSKRVEITMPKLIYRNGYER